MNKRIYITDKTRDLKDYLDGQTLVKAIQQLQEWVKEYGADATLYIDEEGDSYSYSDKEYAFVKIVTHREENDEEYNKRLEQETSAQRERDARELAEFERLQAKFGEKK